MDITSLLGPIVAIGMICVGYLLEGGHLMSMVQLTAALIVLSPKRKTPGATASVTRW